MQNCKRLCKKGTAGDALSNPAHRVANTEDANSVYMETDQETMAGRSAQMQKCQPAMNYGSREATVEYTQQACAPKQTAQADLAKSENGPIHKRQEAAGCAAKMDQANQSCDDDAGGESHSHGEAQGPGHKSTRTCAKPETAVNSRKKTAPYKAAAGNKSILSFYKTVDMESACDTGEIEQLTQDGRVEQQSRPAEKDCQTPQCAEIAVQTNCEANKRQNDTGSMKKPARNRTKLIKDEQTQTARCWSMTVLTHNLMGTMTMLHKTKLNATEL